MPIASSQTVCGYRFLLLLFGFHLSVSGVTDEYNFIAIESNQLNLYECRGSNLQLCTGVTRNPIKIHVVTMDRLIIKLILLFFRVTSMPIAGCRLGNLTQRSRVLYYKDREFGIPINNFFFLVRFMENLNLKSKVRICSCD